MKTKRVLLYGAPSSGKSSLAALVFGLLKLKGQNAELVREYAKDLVYSGLDMKTAGTDVELDIFVNQTKREKLVINKVDFMVTDSPLLLNAFYSHNEYAQKVALESLTENDIHFWLAKDTSLHENEGRSHDREDALLIDKAMKHFLTETCGITLIEVSGNIDKRAAWIVDYLLNNK